MARKEARGTGGGCLGNADAAPLAALRARELPLILYLLFRGKVSAVWRPPRLLEARVRPWLAPAPTPMSPTLVSTSLGVAVRAGTGVKRMPQLGGGLEPGV